jgi:hypothetical protein
MARTNQELQDENEKLRHAITAFATAWLRCMTRVSAPAYFHQAANALLERALTVRHPDA